MTISTSIWVAQHGVRSTQTLIEIYNNRVILFHCFISATFMFYKSTLWVWLSDSGQSHLIRSNSKLTWVKIWRQTDKFAELFLVNPVRSRAKNFWRWHRGLDLPLPVKVLASQALDLVRPGQSGSAPQQCRCHQNSQHTGSTEVSSGRFWFSLFCSCIETLKMKHLGLRVFGLIWNRHFRWVEQD